MKLILSVTLCCCSFLALPSIAKDAQEQGQAILRLIDTFISDNTADHNIIDCSNPSYKATASHKSLFSWSKLHHEDAVKILQRGKGSVRPVSVMTTAETACEKAIEMRGAAYCMRPHNPDYILGLAESFEVCSELFVNVKNMTVKLNKQKKASLAKDKKASPVKSGESTESGGR